MDLQKTFQRISVANYYVSACLLGLAGVIKLNSHEVSELLQFYLDHEFLSLDQLIFLSRNQPVVEIAICLVAILGFCGRYISYFMGCLYLLFAAFIAYAAEGYWFLPIDCGCFGDGEGTMAIVLITRNCILASLLFFVPKDLYRFTLFRFLKKDEQ